MIKRTLIASAILAAGLTAGSAAMAQMTNDTMGGRGMATGTTRMKSMKSMKSKKMKRSRAQRQASCLLG